MICVILESPYAGDTANTVARNVEYARKAMIDCLNRGEAPIASHLLYTQVLSDNNATERKLGIEAGLAWYRAADKVVFYTDYGFSYGMKQALDVAKAQGRWIELRTLPGFDTQ